MYGLSSSRISSLAEWIILAFLFAVLCPSITLAQTITILGDSQINNCETKTYTISILNNSGNPLTNLTVTILLENLSGFSHVSGTTRLAVNGGAAFCTANPTVSSGYGGICAPAPSTPYLSFDLDTMCPGSPFTLNNGDTLTLTFDLAADCSASSGTLNALINYEVGGTTFCDNSPAFDISVLTLDIPNLTVDAVATSVTCQGDGSLTGTNVTVSNNGCGAASGATLRLSSDCGLTFTDQTVDLASGETRDLFFPFSAGITDCNCTYTAEIDPNNTISECDETDNVGLSAGASVIPDIEVLSSSLAIDCSGASSGTVSGTVTLINNGCGPNLRAGIPLRFSLFNDSVCGGSQVTQWTEILSDVDLASGGGTQTFGLGSHNIVADFCADTSNCQVSIHVEADYEDKICEWDGTDNSLCAADVLVNISDLTINSVPTMNQTGKILFFMLVATAALWCLARR